MKNILIFLSIIFVFNGLYAQSGVASKNIPTAIKFHNINQIFGISMRETATVCKDDNGFIWTSSKTGILRIMGNDYRIYQLPFKKYNYFNVKLVYKNSNLYAYSNNGQVFCYNSVYDNFGFLFDMNDFFNNLYLVVNNITVDYTGTIWIVTNQGFYKYQNDEIIKVDNHFSGVSSICTYGNDNLLFVCTDSIVMMNIHNMETKTVYRHGGSFGFTTESLFYDLTINGLWIGTVCNGLFFYDFNTGKFTELFADTFPKQPVMAIEPASESSIFLGIDGQGIIEMDRKQKRIINIYKENEDKNSIQGNGVYDILNDTENQKVWICTYSGGLSYFEKIPAYINHVRHEIYNPNSLTNDNVNQIIEDNSGNIWFATGNGVSCWNVRADKWQTFFRNKQEQAQAFLSLCEDNMNRIWAGTYSSGIYMLDGNVVNHYPNEQNSTFDNYFNFDIFKDSKGDLWFGSTTGKLFRYDSQKNTFETGPVLSIYNFIELSQNELLASSPAGLYQIDKKPLKNRLLLGGFLVMDIMLMERTVWLCTQGNGLVKFDIDSETVREFTIESGLPSNCINSIAFANGYLWLGTEEGLCRFNPANNSIISYSSSLPRVSFNRNAVCRLGNGHLAWGTSSGAIIFDPASLQQTQPEGRIFVQDIIVSGRSIRLDENFELKTPLDSLNGITLGYKHNNLSLEFLPLGNVSDFKFSWFMEGFDKSENNPSDDRKLTYTNIPTGKYVLKIKMYDNSLSRLVDERRLIIRILPPIWEMWWFRVLLLAILVGIIYLFMRFYINRLKRKHTEDKLRFFTNVAHEIRTTVTLIKAPIEELCEKNLPQADKYYLDLAAEQARRLSSTVTHLLDFQKANTGKGQLALTMVNVVDLIEHRRLMFESFAKSKNITINFAAEPANYLTVIDVPKMEEVMDNLISNAIKYSYQDSIVQLLFTGNEKQWELEVKDHGIGISSKAQRKLFREFYRSENAINFNNIGSGIGLVLAKDYVTLHGGEIRVVSRENSGSSFKIIIPLKKDVDVANNQKETEILNLSLDTEEKTDEKNDYSNKIRLLIVEDNEDLQKFMENVLCGEFNVIVANDGAMAWKTILKQMPDIVISDIMMPNMDGFELCRLIKSTYETSHIPVILLTSLAGKAEQLHGLGLGADNYLTKPFDMELVAQRIRSIIQNRKLVREKALKLIDGNRNEEFFINELNDTFIKKAVKAVHENMENTEFDKDEFASAMNVSTSLLYKKIKSLTGQSPVDFIKSIRLKHALELLQTRKYNVTEVGEMCGFSSISYFSRAFKTHFGKSPSEV